MDFKRERPPSPEREDELFHQYLAAEAEVEMIMREVSDILERAEDRDQARSQLLKTHADRLDEAANRARERLDQWLDHVRGQL